MAPRGVAFVAFAALAAAAPPRSSPKPSDDAELEEPKMKKMSAHVSPRGHSSDASRRRGSSAETNRGGAAATWIVRL